MRGLRVACIAVLSVCTAALAFAGKDDKKDTGQKPKVDPQNRTAMSEPMAAIAAGNAKFQAKDYAGALESYKKAAALSPNEPLGHYLVAEANLAAGNVADAQTALATAERSGDKRPDVMGKVLFLQADAKEREAKWAEAKAAWSRYLEWAAKHADAGAVPATATARIQAVDEAAKLEAAYADVRKRIEAEKAEKADAGAGAKGAGPAGKGDGGK